MKLIIQLTILLAIVFNTQNLFSQKFVSGLSDNSARLIYDKDFGTVETEVDYSAIKGNPYLDEKLILGQILLKNGDSLNYYMRYDMYGNEIEYLKDEKLYVILNKSELDYILLDNSKFIFINYVIDDNFHKGFLIQVLDGKYNLYKSKSVEYYEAKMQQTKPFSEAAPAKFSSKKTNWYFSTNSTPITKFKADNSGLKFISQNDKTYKKLRSYTKENGLKIKKEKDMIALFNYYNTL